MHSFRLTYVLLLVACCSHPAHAQVLTWKKGQRDIRESSPKEIKEPRPWEVPVKLVLTPAAEPSPPLKYRCWIPMDQRQPGDVESSVSRAVIMYLQNPLRGKLDSQYAEIAKALPGTYSGDAIPNEELRNQVRDYLDSQADVLKQLYYALRLHTIESNYVVRHRVGLDLTNANAANAQNLRALARLLQLECGLAIAEGRFEDAVYALQSGYRLAELSLRCDTETVLTQLVSLSISGIMNYEVQSLLQLPDAPNMYWALASVPQQELYSPRAAVEGELFSITGTLMPWTVEDIDVASEAQSESRLLELISNVQRVMHSPSREFVPTPTQDRLIAALVVALLADQARIEIGGAESGSCQALVEWTTTGFQAAMEKVLKWSYLPLDLRLARADLIDASLAGYRGIPESPAGILVGLVLPAVQALDSAVARNLRQHSLLITLEALRAYAAENSGALPETLDNLTPLTAWPDTSTGKPFEYQRTDLHHAVIHIEKSLGVPSEYQIEIRQ